MPEAAVAKHNGHAGNRGDGIWLAEALGAAVGDLGSYQGYAMLTDPQGISVPPGVIVEGGILVNTAGRRFVDEMKDIAGMVHPVMAQPGGTAWVILDEGIEARCAYIPESIALRDLNAAKRAETLVGLAEAIGVDPVALTETVADAARAQADGRPDALGRVWGEDRPPSGPYLAFKVCGALYHTQGGLQIGRRGAGAARRWLGLPEPFRRGRRRARRVRTLVLGLSAGHGPLRGGDLGRRRRPGRGGAGRRMTHLPEVRCSDRPLSRPAVAATID